MLKDKVDAYFGALQPEVFPEELKTRCTVFLSGSAGWGIVEGSDERADWDLHVLLSDADYVSYAACYGNDRVIDDHSVTPNVFGQIRSLDWLRQRLEGRQPGSWPMYLWIYTRGIFVRDHLDVSAVIAGYKAKFERELPEMLRNHYVTYAVRRFDTSSAAKRGLLVAARMSSGEMIKAALQTMSLLHNEPFPYNKWLAKHVAALGPDGRELVSLCERCCSNSDLGELVGEAKQLKEFLEQQTLRRVGAEPWVTEWWKFNRN